ncbi:putative endonuclease [Dokdonella immobilis]|uniref:Putative endonuclease n=1 Tax=Dokdonella immobilis TaxID=578942 RepID=A0A1I4WL04_9GAMM|nr:GIY-YIG nuclease family protein [Dokdonella immobilis]SFN14554.1 putative endonuclease [Dokdonella immobilis]
MRERQPCVYVLASGQRGTLYTGVTSNLPKRIFEHRNDLVDGFSSRYHVHDLVWFELHETMASAILREKAIKAWKRPWKIRMIEESNPDWRDLYPSLVGEAPE